MKYIFHGSITESKAMGEGSLFNVPLFRMYEPVYANILFNDILLYKCIQCGIIENFFIFAKSVCCTIITNKTNTRELLASCSLSQYNVATFQM